MATDRGLIIDCQFAADLPPALIDPQRFTQVMSNLTTNAMTYTPAGGLITLSTAVRQHAGNDWITFTVRDTGLGISEQELPHIFERFFRGLASHKSNSPGTGLGLAICQEIVERMGGSHHGRKQGGARHGLHGLVAAGQLGLSRTASHKIKTPDAKRVGRLTLSLRGYTD